MIYVFGDYELDARRYTLRCAGEALKLEPKVVDVLLYLLRARDRVVSKDELIEQVWQSQVITDAALTQCLAKVRKAVNDDGGRQQVIKTQHGRGYHFIADVIERSDEPPSAHLAQDDVPGHETTTPGVPLSPQATAQDGLRRSEAGTSPVPMRDQPSRGRRWLIIVALVLGGSMGVWQLLLRSSSPVEPVPPRPTLTPLVSEKPSLAVLPFVNLSGEAQQEHLADGLTEDVITALSRISGVFVIARNSATTYKGKSTTAVELGRDVGAEYVVEGSVRRMGEHVRVTAQLADTATGYYVWAQRYDRPASDIFVLPDEITQNIVTTLAVKLKEGEVLARRSTTNVEAYDSASRGWEQHNRFTQAANAQARQLFETAVALDPTFTMAHIGLGRTYLLDWLASWDLTPSLLDNAFTIARHVLVLDAALPAAHAFLADVYLLQKQHDQSIAEAQRAINLDPSVASGYVALATVLNYAGRPEEAISVLVEKAFRLDPNGAAYHATVLAHAYFLLRRHAEAEAMLKRTLTRNPDYAFAHSLLVAVYAETSRQTEAEAELAVILRLSPQSSLAVTRDRLPYKEAADSERMIAALQKAGLK